MTSQCTNCHYTKLKLRSLIQQYQQLILRKDQQIFSSHRIIKELEEEKSTFTARLASHETLANNSEERLLKIVSSQDETIEYLKQREIKLISKLKDSEKDIFKLGKDKNDLESNCSDEQTERCGQKQSYITPKKHSHSITLGKENSSFDKSMKQSASHETIKLRVTEDELRVMQIKHKMALLKCAELISLR